MIATIYFPSVAVVQRGVDRGSRATVARETDGGAPSRAVQIL